MARVAGRGGAAGTDQLSALGREMFWSNDRVDDALPLAAERML